jgi:hypothetical protein
VPLVAAACRSSHLNCTLLGGTRTHHTEAQLLKKPSSYGLGTWLWLYLMPRNPQQQRQQSSALQQLPGPFVAWAQELSRKSLARYGTRQHWHYQHRYSTCPYRLNIIIQSA